MSGSNSSSCAICGEQATKACSACNKVHYCTRAHQKIDWKNHKNACAPFRINRNEILGRFVVATRDISAGEIVMRKRPTILGPKTVSPILCLGCHRKLMGYFYKCSKCRWPLCGDICETSAWHKSECQIFAKNCFEPNLLPGDKQTIYSCVVPLRVLLKKFEDFESFQNFLEYQSHLEEHRQTQIYQILKRDLVPLLLNRFQLDTNEEEILRICSILDTNCFEVRDVQGSVNIRGFYSTMSLLSHDCKHNTKHCFDDEFNLVLIATKPIEKGAKITTTYTQTLWGTLARRAHLKSAKHFWCNCLRCRDPTEFGTYAGSVLCSVCKRDDCKVVSNDPLDEEADWECQAKCGHSMSGRRMILTNQTFKKEISLMDKTSPENLEGFLVKYSGILHPTNCHVLEVKYALFQMYGNLPGFRLQELSRELLGRKIDLCGELLDVAGQLDDGWSRLRGCLLYDLQAATVAKANFELDHELITELTAQEILKKSDEYFEEAARILVLEPDVKNVLNKRWNNSSATILNL